MPWTHPADTFWHFTQHIPWTSLRGTAGNQDTPWHPIKKTFLGELTKTCETDPLKNGVDAVAIPASLVPAYLFSSYFCSNDR